MNIDIIHTDDFVNAATDHIINTIQTVLNKQATFVLGLCGGATPKPIYAELAQRGSVLDWKRIIITFGDERCVHPEHSESNYHMVKESLLDKISIPSVNVLRMCGELKLEDAITDYSNKLLKLSGIHGNEIPQHDLLLLGMGDDGHTASLFPGTTAIDDLSGLVTGNYVEKLKCQRITLTFKTINFSKHICFLIRGSTKDALLSRMLSGDNTLPASKVKAQESVTWIVGK